jgi:hypothetical protein
MVETIKLQIRKETRTLLPAFHLRQTVVVRSEYIRIGHLELCGARQHSRIDPGLSEGEMAKTKSKDEKPANEVSKKLKANSARLFANHLIRLQINQDRGSQAWTKFMIVIQSGLGAAYGLMVLQSPQTGIKTILAVAIALVGLSTCLVIGEIIARAHRWSGWYVRKYNELSDEHWGSIFPTDGNEKPLTDVDGVKLGPIATRIVGLCNLIALLWVGAIVVALLRHKMA